MIKINLIVDKLIIYYLIIHRYILNFNLNNHLHLLHPLMGYHQD